MLAVDRDGAGLASTLADGAGERLALASFTVDLTGPSAAEQVFAACARELGPPDTDGNIAGVAGDRSIDASSDDDLDRYVGVNLGITFRVCRAAVAVLTDGGAIVNTSSAVALTGMRGTAPYSAAKAAISGLTCQLAADFGRRGIRVNAVAPGLIETPATADRLAAGAFDEAVTRSRPLARVGTPRDIANAFAFLASDDAAFVTGVTLPVCGGRSTTRFRE